MSVSVDAEKSVVSCAEEVKSQDEVWHLNSVHPKTNMISTLDSPVCRDFVSYFFSSGPTAWFQTIYSLLSLASLSVRPWKFLFLNFARLEPTCADDIPCQLKGSLCVYRCFVLELCTACRIDFSCNVQAVHLKISQARCRQLFEPSLLR